MDQHGKMLIHGFKSPISYYRNLPHCNFSWITVQWQ